MLFRSEKAKEFMEAGVQRLLMTMADHLCDPRLVQDYGAWRAHMLGVLLTTDMKILAGEVEKLDPDALVQTGVAITQGLVDRPEIVGELESILKMVMDASEGRSIRQWMDGTEMHGLDLVRELLRQRGRDRKSTRLNSSH